MIGLVRGESSSHVDCDVAKNEASRIFFEFVYEALEDPARLVTGGIGYCRISYVLTFISVASIEQLDYGRASAQAVSVKSDPIIEIVVVVI